MSSINTKSLLEECTKTLRAAVGESIWRHLPESDKIGLQTAELCIELLKTNSHNFDFSSSTMPLFKVLEKELIDHFYIPYLSYLRVHYPFAKEYIKHNGLDKNTRERGNPDYRRNRILYYNNRIGDYRYKNGKRKSGEIEFTLGNYAPTVGMDMGFTCDKTAIEFYKDIYFVSNSISSIQDWICKTAKAIDSLANQRNQSAHGGYIKNLEDANYAMDTIIKVRKVLLDVISPTIH